MAFLPRLFLWLFLICELWQWFTMLGHRNSTGTVGSCLDIQIKPLQYPLTSELFLPPHPGILVALNVASFCQALRRVHTDLRAIAMPKKLVEYSFLTESFINIYVNIYMPSPFFSGLSVSTAFYWRGEKGGSWKKGLVQPIRLSLSLYRTEEKTCFVKSSQKWKSRRVETWWLKGRSHATEFSAIFQ